MSLKAARYLRSSKDRSDISIDAQRSETDRLAERLGATVVMEWSDVVMSGQDNNRPGFLALKRALQDPDRDWSALLLLDTARLSRDHDGFEQAWIHRECRRRGIAIHYAMLPQTTGAAGALMLQTMRGVDAWHSISSKEKGLAGMRENVAKGFRAGGRAPLGFRLEHFPTGAIRDSKPVLKSRLAPAANAAAVGQYLRDRAAGMQRHLAAKRNGLAIASTSLNGIEWNALTYAGHTVWNVHNERDEGGYIGGQKRRPRDQWVVHYDTHERLISTEEAEQILARLQRPARDKLRGPSSGSLLGGLLVDNRGHKWHGYSEGGGFYRRGKSRRIAAHQVDSAIVDAVHKHLHGAGLAAALARYARQRRTADLERIRSTDARREAAIIDGRINKLTGLLLEMENPRAILDKLDELERERTRLRRQTDEIEALLREQKALANVTEADVARVLERLAADFQAVPQEALRAFLTSLIEKIELDPVSLTVRIHYRIAAANRGLVASPRQHDPIPGAESILRAVMALKIAA